MTKQTPPDGPQMPATIKDALAPHQARAHALQETAGAAVLATLTAKTLGGEFGPLVIKAYRDNILLAAGDPSDPVETMLIEQLLWAHHRLGDIHAKASNAESTELIELYNSSAVRLMAEFRKSSLALREYRAPVVPKQVTVVRQQNVAAGDQQIALVEGGGGPPIPEKKTAHTKLGSNPELLTHVNSERPIITQADRRQAEPVEAKGAYSGRPAEAQSVRASEPSLDAVDRSQDCCRESPSRCER